MKNISLDEIDESEAVAPQLATPQGKTADETSAEARTAPLENEASPAPTPSNLAPCGEPPLPLTLKDALAALKKAEAMPQATKEQKAERDARLARLRPHVAQLQEGVPTPTLTAKDLGSYHHQLVTSARRERLEMLARTNPEIAELLDEVRSKKSE